MHSQGKLRIWHHPQTGEVHLVTDKQAFVCTVGTLPNEQEQEILADANRLVYAWNKLLEEEIVADSHKPSTSNADQQQATGA